MRKSLSAPGPPMICFDKSSISLSKKNLIVDITVGPKHGTLYILTSDSKSIVLYLLVAIDNDNK